MSHHTYRHVHYQEPLHNKLLPSRFVFLRFPSFLFVSLRFASFQFVLYRFGSFRVTWHDMIPHLTVLYRNGPYRIVSFSIVLRGEGRVEGGNLHWISISSRRRTNSSTLHFRSRILYCGIRQFMDRESDLRRLTRGHFSELWNTLP